MATEGPVKITKCPHCLEDQGSTEALATHLMDTGSMSFMEAILSGRCSVLFERRHADARSEGVEQSKARHPSNGRLRHPCFGD